MFRKYGTSGWEKRRHHSTNRENVYIYCINGTGPKQVPHFYKNYKLCLFCRIFKIFIVVIATLFTLYLSIDLVWRITSDAHVLRSQHNQESTVSPSQHYQQSMVIPSQHNQQSTVQPNSLSRCPTRITCAKGEL